MTQDSEWTPRWVKLAEGEAEVFRTQFSRMMGERLAAGQAKYGKIFVGLPSTQGLEELIDAAWYALFGKELMFDFAGAFQEVLEDPTNEEALDYGRRLLDDLTKRISAELNGPRPENLSHVDSDLATCRQVGQAEVWSKHDQYHAKDADAFRAKVSDAFYKVGSDEAELSHFQNEVDWMEKGYGAASYSSLRTSPEFSRWSRLVTATMLDGMVERAKNAPHPVERPNTNDAQTDDNGGDEKMGFGFYNRSDGGAHVTYFYRRDTLKAVYQVMLLVNDKGEIGLAVESLADDDDPYKPNDDMMQKIVETYSNHYEYTSEDLESWADDVVAMLEEWDKQFEVPRRIRESNYAIVDFMGAHRYHSAKEAEQDRLWKGRTK